jgi:hypothetical protein
VVAAADVLFDKDAAVAEERGALLLADVELGRDLGRVVADVDAAALTLGWGIRFMYV